MSLKWQTESGSLQPWTATFNCCSVCLRKIPSRGLGDTSVSGFGLTGAGHVRICFTSNQRAGRGIPRWGWGTPCFTKGRVWGGYLGDEIYPAFPLTKSALSFCVKGSERQLLYSAPCRCPLTGWTPGSCGSVGSFRKAQVLWPALVSLSDSPVFSCSGFFVPTLAPFLPGLSLCTLIQCIVAISWRQGLLCYYFVFILGASFLSKKPSCERGVGQHKITSRRSIHFREVIFPKHTEFSKHLVFTPAIEATKVLTLYQCWFFSALKIVVAWDQSHKCSGNNHAGVLGKLISFACVCVSGFQFIANRLQLWGGCGE